MQLAKYIRKTLASVADELMLLTFPLKHRRAPLPPAEQRLSLAADERKREFHEGKRQEFENYAEEERDGRAARDAAKKPEGEECRLSSNWSPSPQNKTSGAGRASSSGGSSTTTACILPRSTTATPPEAQQGRGEVERGNHTATLTDTLVGIRLLLCAVYGSNCLPCILKQDAGDEAEWTQASGRRLRIIATKYSECSLKVQY